MKTRLNPVRFCLFIFFIGSMAFLASGFFRPDQPGAPSLPSVAASEQVKRGTFTVINEEAGTQLPVVGSRFEIVNVNTGQVVQVLETNQAGSGRSFLLDYGVVYEVRQVQVLSPYESKGTSRMLTISAPNHELVFQNEIKDHVKAYVRNGDGTLTVTAVDFPVPTIMQLPELPNGCEITAMTALLNTYGYQVSKLEMADHYLPKKAFYQANGRLFGADPYLSFAGNPREQSGFFVYGPPIVEAANAYLKEQESSYWAEDLSQSTQEEIIAQLAAGFPVVIWATLDLTPPRLNYAWYLEETGELFQAPVNLHAVVLKGYDDTTVTVMNPLEGELIQDREVFFQSYEALGSHAVVIRK